MKKGTNADRSELKIGSYKLLTRTEKLLTLTQICIVDYEKVPYYQ